MLLLALAGPVGAAGCQARDTRPEDRATAAKPVEYDDDFIQMRASFEKSMRERLARVESRIVQLESRTDPGGHAVAVRLRAQGDAIGSRMRQVRDQPKDRWDLFERDLGAQMDQLERDVDRLVY